MVAVIFDMVSQIWHIILCFFFWLDSLKWMILVDITVLTWHGTKLQGHKSVMVASVLCSFMI